MSYLSGDIEIELKKKSGPSEFVTIPGSDFGLEEGGDWYRDKDDGSWNAHFLFISFQEGYDILVRFSRNGNQTSGYNAEIRYSDWDVLKEENITDVLISDDNLSEDDLVPPEDGGY